jgi:hypothetical protein
MSFVLLYPIGGVRLPAAAAQPAQVRQSCSASDCWWGTVKHLFPNNHIMFIV